MLCSKAAPETEKEGLQHVLGRKMEGEGLMCPSLIGQKRKMRKADEPTDASLDQMQPKTIENNH